MKRNTLAVAVGLILLGTTAVVSGAVITEPVSGLQVWVPDEWVQSSSGHLLRVTDQSGAAEAVFFGMASESLESTRAMITGVLSEHVNDAVTTHAIQNVDLDGVPGLLTSGTGLRGNVSVHWALGAFQERDAALFVVVLADQSGYMPHQNDLSLIMRSVAHEASPIQPYAHEH